MLEGSKKNKKKDILFRPYQQGDEHQIHWYDDKLVGLLAQTVYFWEKYFRYEVIGLKNLSKVKGALLVNNHGLIMFDTFMLARQLVKLGRPPRALAEHATWKVPVIREIFLNMGIVDGTPKNAIRLLRDGQIVIVFPGGAREGLKSHAERYNLYWKNHYGFVKVAIAAGVPIVPCFSAGIDHCYHVFANGYKLGQKIFKTYLPTPVFTGLGAMPFPVKLKHYIGKPIFHNLPKDSYRYPKLVKELHRKVFEETTKLKRHALKNYKPWSI